MYLGIFEREFLWYFFYYIIIFIVGIITFLLEKKKKKRPIWAEKKTVKATAELLKNIEIVAYSVFMNTM